MTSKPTSTSKRTESDVANTARLRALQLKEGIKGQRTMNVNGCQPQGSSQEHSTESRDRGNGAPGRPQTQDPIGNYPHLR